MDTVGFEERFETQKSGEHMSFLASQMLSAKMMVYNRVQNQTKAIVEEYEDVAIEEALRIHVKTLDWLDRLPTIMLLANAIMSHTQVIVICIYWLVLLVQGTLVAAIIPISFIIFALLQYKRPDMTYWLWVVCYTQMSMFLKFIFQLPIFCVATLGSSHSDVYVYSFQPDPYCLSANAKTSLIRFDQLLGVTKASSNSEVVRLLIGDVICLVAVAIHIIALRRKGVWYVSEHHDDPYCKEK
ncbi:hypothetical protein RFI_13586, partial [Reticulomyxa filosa]